jgi:hypothetical protein
MVLAVFARAMTIIVLQFSPDGGFIDIHASVLVISQVSLM